MSSLHLIINLGTTALVGVAVCHLFNQLLKNRVPVRIRRREDNNRK